MVTADYEAADLSVLNADPFEDIPNIHRIARVMKSGERGGARGLPAAS